MIDNYGTKAFKKKKFTVSVLQVWSEDMSPSVPSKFDLLNQGVYLSFWDLTEHS